jgi:PBP1b-binding outer membrane lipoprotein LpoB
MLLETHINLNGVRFLVLIIASTFVLSGCAGSTIPADSKTSAPPSATSTSVSSNQLRQGTSL